MIDRRHLLLGGGMALASLAASPALARQDSAAPPPSPLPMPLPLPLGDPMGTPDFKLLATDWRRVGLRPFREGGVRLEIDPAADIPPGKALIHNYGHGGAGITLAWGCADKVKDLALDALNRQGKQPDTARIIVAGAGAIGLATAAELKRAAPGMTVTVVADTIDSAGNPLLQTTTSWIAGGQFEPSALWKEYYERNTLSELHDLVRRSSRRILQLKAQGLYPDYGIAERQNYILDGQDDDGFAYGIPRDVMPAARTGLLPFAHLAAVKGLAYATWLINPTILLPKLVSDLRAAQVRFEKRRLGTRADLIAMDADIVVNCTGLGARTIVKDTALVPVRGQLVVLQNPDKLDYLFSGGCGNKAAYMFCRQDDIVLGGTFDYTSTLSGLSDKSYLAIRDRLATIFGGDVSLCT